MKMSLTQLQDMKPKMNHLQGLRKIDIDDIRENSHNIFAQRDIEEHICFDVSAIIIHFFM